jgi:hypothetical protein
MSNDERRTDHRPRRPVPFLLTIDGRKVLDLHAAANDASRLAPGFYFCTLDNGAKRISRKVVLTGQAEGPPA